MINFIYPITGQVVPHSARTVFNYYGKGLGLYLLQDAESLNRHLHLMLEKTNAGDEVLIIYLMYLCTYNELVGIRKIFAGFPQGIPYQDMVTQNKAGGFSRGF